MNDAKVATMSDLSPRTALIPKPLEPARSIKRVRLVLDNGVEIDLEPRLIENLAVLLTAASAGIALLRKFAAREDKNAVKDVTTARKENSPAGKGKV